MISKHDCVGCEGVCGASLPTTMGEQRVRLCFRSTVVGWLCCEWAVSELGCPGYVPHAQECERSQHAS
jgi:hypothetical protein